MSMLGFSSDRDKTRRKSCHRRKNSGELDVFDAEGYFSSINEKLGQNGTTLFHELGIAIRDDCSSSNRQGWREGRVSLDIPAMKYTNNNHYHHHHHHHHHYTRQHSVSQTQSISSSFDNTKEKKHKQPSSPGGKLASFFNSLVNHARKKKSSSKLEEDQNPNFWRRRSRSSNILSSSNTSTTSTRTITTNTSDTDHTKQTQSFPGFSGFRSSPPYPINTPTKSYKDFSTLSKSKNSNSNSTTKPNNDANLDWLDKKFKCIGVKQSNKGFDNCHTSSSDKERSWVGRNSSVESGGFKRFTEDDGAESDSSSDLFELQLNYECSSGLPVYESTCMDSIKRSSSTPVTNI